MANANLAVRQPGNIYKSKTFITSNIKLLRLNLTFHQTQIINSDSTLTLKKLNKKCHHSSSSFHSTQTKQKTPFIWLHSLPIHFPNMCKSSMPNKNASPLTKFSLMTTLNLHPIVQDHNPLYPVLF